MSLQAKTLYAEQEHYWGHMQFYKLMNGKQEMKSWFFFFFQHQKQ